MYPRLSDLINDLLGTQLNLPVKTFGFFLALAFAGAFFVLIKELRRRETEGHFRLRKVRIRTAGPMSITEVITGTVIWGLVGYKLGLLITDYELFNTDTEAAIMSTKGYWLTGLLGAGAAFGLRYRKYLELKESKETFEEPLVGPSHYVGIVVTIAFVAGILGSKLFAHLEDPAKFMQDPIGNLLSFDGLSFLGGLIAAGVAILWYLKRKGFDSLISLDAFAPSVITGYAIGRIGCHMAGDGDWGIVNLNARPGFLSWLPDWLWAYDYPHNVIHAGVPIPGCSGEFCSHLAQPVYPTPIYETIMGFIILGILWSLRKKLKYVGQLCGVWLSLIGVERFLVEGIRINDRYNFLGMNLSQAQIISVFLVLGGMFLFFWTRQKGWTIPDYREANKEAGT